MAHERRQNLAIYLAYFAIAALAIFAISTGWRLFAPPTTPAHNAAPPNERCGAVVDKAAAQGVRLEDHVRLICPGKGITRDGRRHLGVTCYPKGAQGPEGPCEYVSISVDMLENDDELYAVYLHEAYHSLNDSSDECAADAFARSKGAQEQYLYYDC